MDLPPFDKFYEDEFGAIDREVFRVAEEVWNQHARFFADECLRDKDEGWRLMLKTAANVSRARANNGEVIDNLPGYIFSSFKYLVYGEIKKENNRKKILENSAPDRVISEENRILDRIEVEDILQNMESSAREIFELHHILGFTFEELAPKYNTSAGTIRSKLSKALMKIRKTFSEKTEQMQK